MSEPLAARWAAVKARGNAALIPYITAGFPDAGSTRAMLAGAAAAGADIIELGVPWSDPVADGPVIQASTHEALRGGMSLEKVLGLLASVPSAPPTIIFSYVNPILAFGPERFAERALAAGAAGILVTDLPVGTDPALEQRLRSSGLPLVRLVAPTTKPDRLAEIAAASEGFVYLVARLGVTGRGNVGTWESGKADLAERVMAARSASGLPVAVGFGISEAEQARVVAGFADGVVIGSALVEKMKGGGAGPALAWLAEIRRAIDGAGNR